MLNYAIEIKDDIMAITIKKEILKDLSKKDLEELNYLSHDMDIHSFLDWVDWLPISDMDKEMAYWEAKYPQLSPLMKLKNTVDELENEIKSLKEENENLKNELNGYGEKIKEKNELKESQLITLKLENQKLKNKLSAYESHKKK